jgi:hypothetical protein
MPTTTELVRRALPVGTLSYSGPGPIPNVILSTNYRQTTNSRTHSGPVPSYRERIRSGSDATSILSGTRFKMDTSYGHIVNVFFDSRFGGLYTCNEEAGVFSPVQEGFPSFATLSTSGARNQAIMCAHNKALRLQQSLLTGVFLGELGQTLRMIRNPAMALRSGLSNYLLHLRRLRGQVRSSDSLISLAGNLWLEYAFGWRQLVNDVLDGTKALAENATRSPFNANWAYVRCYGRELGNPQTSSNVVSRATYRYTVHRRQVDESDVIVRACVRTYATNPAIANRKSLGLSLEDFVPTVWNLIPYSFLVDYFTNIGDLLSAWSHRNSLLWWWNTTTLSTRRVEKTCGDYRRTKQPNAFEKVLQDNFSPASFSASCRTVVRTPEEGAMIPAIEFTHPEFSSLRWLNLASLGAQHRALLPYRH